MAIRKRSKVDIQQIARDQLGYESLRPGQKEAVEAILVGTDTLVVQPTGSGKSAIYESAGLLIDGATVVISPLIVLQKDQVESIEGEIPADAVALNSVHRSTELRERLKQIENSNVEYILLAPEQLAKQDTVDRLERYG
jgi:ATP-dependent DNA helicase RecQ